ncbi:MAG TPA: HD-GYP domain-containing protein [bacterium]|nr:HD-GYP domain-containing protein [bacterium]
MLPSPESHLTLLHRFTVASLISTLLVGVIFAAIAGRLAENYAFQSQARATALYVSEFIAPRLVAKDFEASAGSRVQFEFALKDLIGKAGISRVSVWNRKGELLFGPPPARSALPPDPALQNAMRGHMEWRLLRVNRVQQMEIYVPILLKKNGLRPVGVYHVISVLGELGPTLARLKWLVWGVVIFAMLLLYTVLFSIVREASRKLERQEAALRRAFAGVVQSLANAVDARDNALANHSSRVSYYGAALAKELGLNDTVAADAQIVGALHDVGKIGIPDGVLTKRGPLTHREWGLMRLHPVYGYEILRPIPVSDGIKLGVRHSHERWDGEGYPDGLSGTRIPVVARIIAVADAYEALTTDRPYRKALTPEEALEEIRRCAGTQFDPQVVSALVRVLQYAPRTQVAFAAI